MSTMGRLSSVELTPKDAHIARMNEMTALVTGATGLIGRRLLERFTEAKVLSRNPRQASFPDSVNILSWDPTTEQPPDAAFDGVDVVFHLAGEPVGQGRWTAEKKRAIRDSRVTSTRLLVEKIESLRRRPKVLVSASAVGIYGDRGDEVLDESSPAVSTFLGEVCAAWEREAIRARGAGLRVVTPRIGVVLAPQGGALERMVGPFKLGLGGPLAGGRQWMPWVHVDDVVGLLLHAAGNESIHGAMNVVSPQPATNRDFTRALGRVLRRPVFLSVPKAALQLAFGELSSVLLASQRVVPKVASDSGYAFRYPDLDSALRACFPNRESRAA
jgi:uncharacterized protein (TIGR01777 family)